MCIWRSASSVSLRASSVRQRERETNASLFFFFPSVRAPRRPFCRDRLNMRRSFSPLAPACNSISARRGAIVTPLLCPLSLRPGELPPPPREEGERGAHAARSRGRTTLVPAAIDDPHRARRRCRRQVALTNWKLIQSDRARSRLRLLFGQDAEPCRASPTAAHARALKSIRVCAIATKHRGVRDYIEIESTNFLKYACRTIQTFQRGASIDLGFMDENVLVVII